LILPKTAWQSRDVAQHYDELDEFYRELWGEHVHHGLWLTGQENTTQATEQLLHAVAERAQLRTAATVCDVGAGYGATARWLSRRYHAQVTALTISPAQYAYAQAQPWPANLPQPLYLLQDWLKNSLPAQAFDAVLAIESTEHMDDRRRCFAEAFRVLRPGGRIVICAWLARPSRSTWEMRHLLEPICREGRLAGLGTADEYRQLLQQTGFLFESFTEVGRQVRHTWAVVLWRMLRGLATRAEYWRYLFNQEKRERVFGWTVMRMWLAFHFGALQYGMLTAMRPWSSSL